MKHLKTLGTVVASALSALALALAPGLANAALPAAVGTSITSMQTDSLALADLVWPPLIALTAVAIVMKMFKRFSSKI